MLNVRAVFSVLSLSALVVLAAVPSAGAAGATKQAWAGCDGGYNSGSFDSAGRTYVPCGDPTKIQVYSASGALENVIALDRYVTDVEPVGDGSLLYLAGHSGPQRLVRAANGSYSVDASWSPARYPMNGTTYAAGGLFVDSDAAGNVYYADGFWAANSTHTVVQYSPSGAFVTRFGAYAENSWALGGFYWALGGIAVSPDGNRIITTETGNNRLQVWQRGAGGAFSATSSLGGTAQNNADREGYCNFSGWEGKFAAPYDVSLDAAGNVYVINTSCTQLLRFSPDLASVTANVDLRPGGGDSNKPHGFAVAANGTVFVGQSRAVVVPDGVAVNVQAPNSRVATSAPIVTGAPGAAAAGGGGAAAKPKAFRPTMGRLGLLAKRRGPYTLTAPVACATMCNMRIAVKVGKKTIARKQLAWWDGRKRTVTVPLKRRFAKGTKLQVTMVATSANGIEFLRTGIYRVTK